MVLSQLDNDCKFLDTNFFKFKKKKKRIEMPSLNMRDFGQLLNRRYSAFMQNLSILVSGNVLCFDSYIFLRYACSNTIIWASTRENRKRLTNVSLIRQERHCYI